jgi:hypothetical protein
MGKSKENRMNTDTDRLFSMSLLLKAIEDCDQELTEFKAEHKARREKLMGELAKLRWEVLSGQDRLPLEPIEHLAMKAVPIETIMEKVVREVNSGTLNTPRVTCTASMSNAPDAESSTEEKARTRKQKKMQGQDAILPDHRPTQAPAQPPAGD